MIFAGKTAVFLTAQSAVLAYRPVIKDAYFFLNTVKEFPAASFKMDFNDTLYVENTLTGARFLYSDPSMFAAAPFPFASSGGCDYPQQGGPNQGQQQGDGGFGPSSNFTGPNGGQGFNSTNFNSSDPNQQIPQFQKRSGAPNQSGPNGPGCGGGGPNNFPNATILLQGIYAVTCSNPTFQMSFTMPSTFTGPFNPSSSDFPYFVGPPSADPIATILNIATGGLNIVPTVFPNRAFFGKIIASQQDFSLSAPDTVCSVSKNSTSPWKLVNANGEEVVYPSSIEQRKPQCTYEGAKSIIETIESTSALATSMTSFKQIEQLMNAFDVLKAMEGMAGCLDYLNQFLTFSNETITLENSRDCPYRYEDPEFMTNPCCNRGIIDQCCAPSTRFLTVDVISSVDEDLISVTCNNPANIQAVLNLAATASNNGAKKAPYDPSSAFQTYSSFLSECQDTVFQKTCTSNSDCIYSKKCGNDGRCSADYNNPGPLLFACYVATMQPDLLVEVAAKLDIPSTFASAEEEALAIAAVLVPQVSSPSCNGPTGWEHNGNYEVQYLPDGNIEMVYVPGNQTACLEDKRCNYEPWNRATEASCLADSAPGYCAICDNFWCNPISQPRKCTLDLPYDENSATKEEICDENGGRFESNSWQSTCYLDSRKSSRNSCFSFNNGSSCYSGSSDDWKCSQSFCKSTETQSACQTNHAGDWNVNWQLLDGGDACVYRNLDYNTCKSQNMTWVPGVRYDAGSYDSSDSCPSQFCEDFISGDRSNKTQCESNAQCTRYACTVCQSFSFWNGGCFNTSITTQETCDGNNPQTWYMRWNSDPEDDSKGLCQYSNYFDRSSCLSANLTYYNANDAGLNDTACAAFPSAFQATMQPNRECPDRESCLAAGECDDWEHQRYGANGMPQDGVCLYTPEYQWNCGSDRSTRLGKCINETVVSAAGCSQLGLVWQTRAKTQQECQSLGSYCNLPDGGFSAVSSSQCLGCGGDVRYAYTWSTPLWRSSNFVNTTWVSPIAWSSVNTWGNSLDWGKLSNFISDAIATIVSRQLINDFNEQNTLLSKVFSTVSCDCVAKRSDCFDEVIKSPLGSCVSDVSQSSSCQGVQITPSTFNSTTPVSTSADLISSASFVGSDESESGGLSKRATKKIRANYKVVKNDGGVTVGQIIGNAVSYNFSQPATESLSVCLTIDSSIPLNKAEYPIYDLAPVYSNGSLGAALYTNVTISGTSICGTVPAFQSATFIPIARNSVSKTAIVTDNNNNVATSSPTPGTSSASALDLTVTSSRTANENNNVGNSSPIPGTSSASTVTMTSSLTANENNNVATSSPTPGTSSASALDWFSSSIVLLFSFFF